MRPESFDAELQEDWSHWVLEHGLPRLPALGELPAQWAVPVSYWIGPDTGAVLHIRRWELDDEARTETDVDCFYRTGDTWVGSGSGGTSWSEDLPLTRVSVPARHVGLTGISGGEVGERSCKAVWGEVGDEAALAEVIQSGVVTRRPIEAPLGLLVVCGQATRPLTVRVLSGHGELLAQVEEHSGWDMPIWPGLGP